MNYGDLKNELASQGYAVAENIYADSELHELLSTIDSIVLENSNDRPGELFAIRRFLKEVPDATPVIFNQKLLAIIAEVFNPGYFLVKAIYFNKPPALNWFVAYHQDLTISVDCKQDLPGFGSWTVKQQQFSVQPPLNILQNNVTIRIHLDDTTERNGALKVVPQSHLRGILRKEDTDPKQVEKTCCVSKGGIMIMKPLLLHVSDRTTNQKQRRVLHLEFSNQVLPAPLCWAEYLSLF